VGVALSAVPLAFGISSAIAAKTTPAAKLTKVTCVTKVGITIAVGDTGVVPPASQGQEYGTADCGKVLGHGVQRDTFTVPDSGDTDARFTMYFPTGSIHGTYVLSAQEGTFSGTNFTGTNYDGTLKVKGGTGAFAGAKGTGKMKCASGDGIHTTCTDKLKLKQL
jgi:hypothetical protein